MRSLLLSAVLAIATLGLTVAKLSPSLPAPKYVTASSTLSAAVSSVRRASTDPATALSLAVDSMSSVLVIRRGRC